MQPQHFNNTVGFQYILFIINSERETKWMVIFSHKSILQFKKV